jgi:hypothetical protein
VVDWLTGTRGNDPSGPRRVAAAFRAPGAPAFGAPEIVSGESVQAAPSVAIDAAGRPLAAWNTLDQDSLVAVRPGG